MKTKEKTKIHRAKKSLGQNFLKSALALKEIVKAGEILPSDTILEIGPGKGALTSKLLETGATVLAVEKDRDLFEFLQEKFSEEIKNKKIILKNEDILEFKIKTYIGYRKYKIIANIPYNITGAILKKFLTEGHQPEKMVLLVQREVAQRIVANNKKESILSISVKAYGEPKVIMKVPARYFSPAPKVDSAVIHIKNISRALFNENNIKEEDFWEILRAGFAQKRKKLSNNLKKIIKKEVLEPYKDKRAEDLGLLDWVNITKQNK